MTDFRKRYLQDTLKAIYSFTNSLITVRKVRKYLRIQGSDRSKISFISRSLKLLEDEGFLKISDSRSPKNYKTTFFKEKISIPDIVFCVLNEKKIS